MLLRNKPEHTQAYKQITGMSAGMNIYVYMYMQKAKSILFVILFKSLK